MSNERWLPYPGAPTQWFYQRWPQPANAARPAFLLEPVGTTPGTWSNSGTGFGVNAPTGFAGSYLDLQLAGSSKFRFQEVAVSAGARATHVLTPSLNIGSAFNQPALWPGSGASTDGFLLYNRAGSLMTTFSMGNMEIRASDGGNGVVLNIDATNQLAQRSGTSAQSYRLYNTYTSSTSFERLNLTWSSNTLLIGTEKGSGGGTARALEIQTDAITRLAFDTIGSVRIVTALTVATLPASPTTGMVARVNNALSPTLGATVAGGGSANALVWYNGTNWTVFGI